MKSSHKKWEDRNRDTTPQNKMYGTSQNPRSSSFSGTKKGTSYVPEKEQPTPSTTPSSFSSVGNFPDVPPQHSKTGKTYYNYGYESKREQHKLNSGFPQDNDGSTRARVPMYPPPHTRKEGNIQKARRKYAERVREELGRDATDEEVLAAVPVPPKPRNPIEVKMSIAEMKWNRIHNILHWVPHNNAHFEAFNSTGRPRIFSSGYMDSAAQLQNHAPWLRPTSYGASLDWTSLRGGIFSSGPTTWAVSKFRQMQMGHMFEKHVNPHAPYIADAWSVYARPPQFWASMWLPISRTQWKAQQGFITWHLNADDTNQWEFEEEDLIDMSPACDEYEHDKDENTEERLERLHAQMIGKEYKNRRHQHQSNEKEGDHNHVNPKSCKNSHSYECFHTVSQKALSKYLPLPIASMLQLPSNKDDEKEEEEEENKEAGKEDRNKKRRNNKLFSSNSSSSSADATPFTPWKHFQRANPAMAAIMTQPNQMRVDQLNGKREDTPPLDFVLYFLTRVFVPLGIDGSPTSPALTNRHNAWRLGDVQSAFVMTGGANILKRLGPETDYEYDQFYQEHPFYDTETAEAYDGTTLYPRKFLNRREIHERSQFNQEKNLQGESSRLSPNQISYESRSDGPLHVHVSGLKEGDFFNQILLKDDKDNTSSQWIRAGRPFDEGMNINMRDHFHAHAAALLGFIHAPPVRLIDFETQTNEWENYLFKFLCGTKAAQIPCQDPRWTWTVIPIYVPSVLALPPDWFHILTTRIFASVNSPHAEDQSEQFAAIYIPEIHPPVSIQHADPFLQNSHTHLSFQREPDDTEADVGPTPPNGEGKVFHAHAELSSYMQFHVKDIHTSQIHQSQSAAYMLRAQQLYNEALDHAHQILNSRFSPEHERPARILLPPQAPKHFLHRSLIVHWTLSANDVNHRKRTETELEQAEFSAKQSSSTELTPFISQWKDNATNEFPLENFSSVDLRQTTRLTLVTSPPDHTPSVPAVQTVSETPPADTQSTLFVLYRETVLMELATDIGNRVLRQWVLPRNTPGDAATAGTVAPKSRIQLRGNQVPHLATTPSIDVGGRYVGIAQRDDIRLTVLNTANAQNALQETFFKDANTTSPPLQPITSPIQVMTMDHDSLTYAVENSNQFITLRNWQEDAWGDIERVDTVQGSASVNEITLIASDLGFYAWYDRTQHTLYAQFRSPNHPFVSGNAPPLQQSLAGSHSSMDVVTSLSVRRVHHRTFLLFGSANGRGGVIETEWNPDGGAIQSTPTQLLHHVITDTAIESIGFGGQGGGNVGHWRIVENTFLDQLATLFLLNESSANSGTLDLSASSSHSSLTGVSLTQSGGSLSKDNGIFPRVGSDTFEISSGSEHLQLQQSVIQDNSNNFYTHFTIALWFRRTSGTDTADDGAVFQSHKNNHEAVLVQLEQNPAKTSTFLRLHKANNLVTTLKEDVHSDNDISFREWTLLTIAVDTNQTNGVSYFVNDELTHTESFDALAWGDLYFGSSGQGSASGDTAQTSFHGWIDYISVWTMRKLPLLDVHLWFNGQRGLPPMYLYESLSDEDTQKLSKTERSLLHYVYTTNSDSQIHLWDIKDNIVRWEYRWSYTEDNNHSDGTRKRKHQDIIHNDRMALTDFVTLSPPLSTDLPYSDDPGGILHPDDIVFVQHISPYMIPQVQGRTVAFPNRFQKSNTDRRVIVADNPDKNSERPEETFLHSMYSFPRLHTSTVKSTPKNKDGVCVFPFGRLQVREQWNILLTGNAWTLAFWTQLGSFLFSDAPDRYRITEIPLVSLGNQERNLRLRLKHAPERNNNTLATNVTNYYRLNDIDPSTGTVVDLAGNQNGQNEGAALHETDTLPLHAASQVLEGSQHASSDFVTTFPYPAIHNTSSTYIDTSGAFQIAANTTFSLGLWIHPDLNRDDSTGDTSENETETILRTAPHSNTMEYLEISYTKQSSSASSSSSSSTVFLQARDQSQFIQLETDVSNNKRQSSYNSGGHPWMYVLVTRDHDNILRLIINDEVHDKADTAVSGALSATSTFIGKLFRGGIRDVGFWNGRDLHSHPTERDILYNYGEIRTYPFDVPYHQSWILEAVGVHPQASGPSHEVFVQHVRTPVNMHAWALHWQALSFEWEMDWDTNEHVFSVWHGTGYTRNATNTQDVLHSFRVDRKTYPSFLVNESVLWLGASPAEGISPFDNSVNGYPQPCFAHISAWSRHLSHPERAFFLLADRQKTAYATKLPEEKQGEPLTEARALQFSQYGRRREHERAGEVKQQRDIPRRPHRRWLWIASHKDMPVPMASVTFPILPEIEEQFHQQLQSKSLPSDLRNALSKNGAQVVYYTWGGESTERPDAFGNQEANYATYGNVWEDKFKDQTPLRPEFK
jgi:hypothetical protein